MDTLVVDAFQLRHPSFDLLTVLVELLGLREGVHDPEVLERRGAHAAGGLPAGVVETRVIVKQVLREEPLAPLPGDVHILIENAGR